MSEPAPLRQELARKLGAVEVVDPDELPSVPQPRRLRPDEPSDVVFECSGIPQAHGAGPRPSCGRGGTPRARRRRHRAAAFDANRILLNELRITGAFVYDAGGFEEALELLAGGAIPLDLLIEPDDVPLDGLLEAIARAGGRTGRWQGHGRTGGAVMAAPTLGNIRLNHVAMSVPPDLLDAEGRAALDGLLRRGLRLRRSSRPMTEDGQRLVFGVHAIEPVPVPLSPTSEPMACPRLDHFGIPVDTEAELDEILRRAQAYQAKDDRGRHRRQARRRGHRSSPDLDLRPLPAADDDRGAVVVVQVTEAGGW